MGLEDNVRYDPDIHGDDVNLGKGKNRRTFSDNYVNQEEIYLVGKINYF